MIKKDNEKMLSDLVKQYKLAESPQGSTNALEFLISAIIYFSQLRPNLNNDNPLSIMEMLCMIILATGYNPDRCADLLGVSPKTIKTYEQRIREKLNAKNRVHAFYLAQKKEFISLMSDS